MALRIYLAALKPPSGGGTAWITPHALYDYDGLDRCVRKFLPDGSDWTVREYYYNTAWQVLEVRKEGGKAREGGAEPRVAANRYEQHVWSPRYVDAPVIRDRDADGDANHTLEERLYYTSRTPTRT